MDTNNSFNLMLFTDDTKKVCMCSAISIFMVILFIISPLNTFFKTSLFMKFVALNLVIYTIYLNNKQTNLLRSVNELTDSQQVKSQLNMNMLCSYIFTLFLGLLLFFIIKSFF